MVGKSSPSIFTNAKSVLGSVPITRPLNSRLSFSFTLISSAPSITWLFVTIYPSLEMMTPEPNPTRGSVCTWRCCPRPSPKKKSKKSGACCTVLVFASWVDLICTTAWREFSAAWVKSTGWALTASKAANFTLGFCLNISLKDVSVAVRLDCNNLTATTDKFTFVVCQLSLTLWHSFSKAIISWHLFRQFIYCGK